MSAELMAAALVIDNQRQPDFKAGHKAIERLKATDLEFPNEYTDDDPETPEGLARIRAVLAEALSQLEWLLTDDREVDSIEVRGATVHITGGVSYGDPPTDLFALITRLQLARGVLHAVGFENEP